MSFIEIYLLGFGVVLGMMTGLWLVSVAIKDSSIVDIFWGAGFGVAAIAYYLMTDGESTRSAIVTIFCVVWGLRLSAHIGYRNIGKGEDFRYKKWREDRGPSYWWFSFFKVFLLQGVILWIVSAPLLQAQFHDGPRFS